MLGIIVGSVFLLAVVIFLFTYREKLRMSKPRTSRGPTLLYSPDSRDIAAEVYYPAIRDSTALFPLRKREERKKTETFENRK
ncbi:hypothetical protein EU527_05400 [Candidatus Thorarchaeota archaeon]|nr:MAG: hypothetical protein EU527_05400 [Candidatus Thorarchaeota archaeon]